MLRFLRFPARVPLRLPESDTSQKVLAALVIGLVATAAAVAWRHLVYVSDPMERLDYQLYDMVYETRTPEDRTDGPVVIVAIDQDSLGHLQNGELYGQKVPWPWPRDLYGSMIEYFEKAGARAVGFDMIFAELDKRSITYGADQNFADSVASVKIPVVFGNQVDEHGQPTHFAIPIRNPTLGAVNSREGILRKFEPFFNGYPSLAYRCATAYAGHEPQRREGYLAHLYGPYQTASGQTTYRYVRAFSVLAAIEGDPAGKDLDPAIFRDKIVLIGGIAPGMGDNKLIPLRSRNPGNAAPYAYPGVEW